MEVGTRSRQKAAAVIGLGLVASSSVSFTPPQPAAAQPAASGNVLCADGLACYMHPEGWWAGWQNREESIPSFLNIEGFNQGVTGKWACSYQWDNFVTLQVALARWQHKFYAARNMRSLKWVDGGCPG